VGFPVPTAAVIGLVIVACALTGCANTGDTGPTGTAASQTTPPNATASAPPPTAESTTMPRSVTSTTLPSAPTPPADVVPFTDGEALAEMLAAAETALADPTTPPGEQTRWAWVQQQALRDLVTHPAWRADARGRIPSWLRAAFDLNLRAGTRLRRLTEPRPALPAWTIVAPPPLGELRSHYRAAEAESGVPWTVLAAIHLVETRFGRIQGDSHAGARGPMQFLPATWEAYGEGDIDDPGDATMAAARYLVAHGAPEDLPGALYAYNHSDLYVDAVLAHAKVMARYDHYLAIYHRWRVYYRTVEGDVLLAEGYHP
jgi:soluble lytic murein transglycosylase-like protein